MSENKNFFRASAEDFKKIPGSPVAYWVSEAIKLSFHGQPIGSLVDTAQGMKTLDNERFVRLWFEVSMNRFGSTKWFPVNHGGGFRKWYGNNECVINWADDGREIKVFAVEKYNSVTRTVTGMDYYFRPGITWTAISSSNFSARSFPTGFLFTNAGMCAFGEEVNLQTAIALLNSKVAGSILEVLSPTINFGPNQIKQIPVVDKVRGDCGSVANMISICRKDWDAYETSWDFMLNPLVAKQNNPVNPVENDGSENICTLSEIYAVFVVGQITWSCAELRSKSDKVRRRLSHCTRMWDLL